MSYSHVFLECNGYILDQLPKLNGGLGLIYDAFFQLISYESALI